MPLPDPHPWNELVAHPGPGHALMNAEKEPIFGPGRLAPLRARHDAVVEADTRSRLLSWFRAHLDGAE